VKVTDFKPESSELPDMETDHFDPSSLSFSSGLMTGGFSSPNISVLIFFSKKLATEASSIKRPISLFVQTDS
jgi:hypothetical protein